ncbi:MAG TPA: HEAT repeat domain-containing protein [Urbifossiella sp.]|nr:HEAT repeat domain-containing protein [Urbifossiella sp.]
MFGWFAPRLSIPTAEKVLAERRMTRLAGLLGLDRLRTAPVVLPTPEFFPDPFHGDEPSAAALLRRLCGYMKVDPDAVRLEVRPDDQMTGAAGLYEPGRRRRTIAVTASRLGSPVYLVPVLAHELGHEILLGGGLLTHDDPEHEWLTDLVPTWLGLGVLSANGTVYSAAWSEGQMAWWQIGRQGYLTSREIGYALALFAFARGEDRPGWGRFLRPDAAEPLRAGLRYLLKTGDTLFHPDTAAAPDRPLDPAEIRERLRHGSPGFRLDALWRLTDGGPADPGLLPAVRGCLGSQDHDIVAAAVAALAAFGPAAAEAVPELIQALWYGEAGVRPAAAAALGRLGADPDTAVPALGNVRADRDSAVVRAAVEALSRFGPAAAPCVPQLTATIAAAVVAGQFERVNETLLALRAVTPDVREAIRDHLPDPEHQRQARMALKELGSGSP